ncbi:hypothetical protein CBR_g45235 [Chara braunii]|uniref:Cellulose synthase n=1 Tax=Chara braunii TaxID=69332 RepID=A0A388K3F6_CHABU|nr:hypothetical protein CBR_g45235 [Chara braunii]|eukprot:GBG64539.1 hypothetical protein CBR_g45235 [Chara braunii]
MAGTTGGPGTCDQTEDRNGGSWIESLPRKSSTSVDLTHGNSTFSGEGESSALTDIPLVDEESEEVISSNRTLRSNGPSGGGGGGGGIGVSRMDRRTEPLLPLVDEPRGEDPRDSSAHPTSKHTHTLPRLPGDGDTSAGSSRGSSVNEDDGLSESARYGYKASYYSTDEDAGPLKHQAARGSTGLLQQQKVIGGGGGGGGGDRTSAAEVMWNGKDVRRAPLQREVPIALSKLLLYRLVVLGRLVVMILFLRYRVLNPNPAAYGLWLASVACEVWFGFSWILDQLPKWSPVTRKTYLDRLSLRFERAGEESTLPPVDVFVSTADAEKEPPLVTANVILSILAMDYPPERVSCYLSDDGAALLTFEAMAETACFARSWIPFCKTFDIEPRAPEVYFSMKFDYTVGKTRPDFVMARRQLKQEYEEFKVRVNALVQKSKKPPSGGFRMSDGSAWPGQYRSDHPGMIQVFLQPEGMTRDIQGNALPRLVYISREKRPRFDHNKKAGAMNALLRASALVSNGAFILNLDCDHYVNNSKAMREAICYLMDPVVGDRVSFVQFPQRFDGVDKNDRYANHNFVFFDVNMKGLDGQQGPMYVGTGCVFRRQAVYGLNPPRRTVRGSKGQGGGGGGGVLPRLCKGCYMCLCGWCWKGCKSGGSEDVRTALIPGHTISSEEALRFPSKWHAQRFGMCSDFVITTMDADGRVPYLTPLQLLNDVILVISCGYEDNTEWGRTVGWMYGSVTEDIVTGLSMHVKGWRSVYAMPSAAAFKGSAPINLTDRLGQVLRWATGSVEIFFSRHNPMWCYWGRHLQFVERVAYINTAVYPFTSVALIVYCLIPAICLFTDKFIVGEIDDTAVLWFLLLFLFIFLNAGLEIFWSQISLEDWWRNEQFWVIGGSSAHLVAVMQGLLKVFAGVDTSFTLTAKAAEDDDEFGELYAVRFTWLMIPPTVLMIVNLFACVVGFAREVNRSAGNKQWGQLLGKTFFSFWVLIHLYPFVKGLTGRAQRLPTTIVLWSLLVAVIIALLWVQI